MSEKGKKGGLSALEKGKEGLVHSGEILAIRTLFTCSIKLGHIMSIKCHSRKKIYDVKN